MPIKSMPTGLSRVYWLGQAFPFKEKISQKIIRSVKEKPLQIVPYKKVKKVVSLSIRVRKHILVNRALD